jgi:A/G-specific adenine glycosylase
VTPFADALLAWFARSQRDLPWRNTRTPYRVWISEVMLQQTHVATVIPYFERWLARFPDIHTLAAASQDEVLKRWEGLGYYRRARLLHQCARVIDEQHGGQLPETYADLRNLPGIGTYTAAAIASFVFAEPVVAVDGNVKRVAARLFELPNPSEAEVKSKLEPHLPHDQPGAFNEAMIELGAVVCGKKPACNVCPLRNYCQAYQQETVAQFPAPKAKKTVPHFTRYASVYRRDNALWLSQRQDEGKTGGLLRGLWGFPLTEDCPVGETLEPVKHAYTHFKLTVHPVLVSTQPAGDGQLVDIDGISDLALSKVDHKILARVQQTSQGLLF